MWYTFYIMIDWLLFFKIDDNFSHINIIFKRRDSDINCIRIDEKIDNENLIEIENIILNLINLYVPIRENVYVVLDQENITKYKLEKFMPKLSSRIHQVIYANV